MIGRELGTHAANTADPSAAYLAHSQTKRARTAGAQRASIRQSARARRVRTCELGSAYEVQPRALQRRAEPLRWVEMEVEIDALRRHLLDVEYPCSRHHLVLEVGGWPSMHRDTQNAISSEHTAQLGQRCDGKMRPATAEMYRRLFARYIREPLGGMLAQELRASHLDRLYGDMLADGRRQARSRRGAGLMPGTVATTHAMLSGMFNRAMKRGDVPSNPCKRAFPPTAQAAETPVWSLEQTQKFFAHEAVRADPLYPMLRLMAVTGLRRGEACGLMIDDVDLDGRVIHIRHNAVPVDGKVVIGPPKTRRSVRRVTVGTDSVQLLRDHLSALREHRSGMGAGWRDHGLVFPGVDGASPEPYDRVVEVQGAHARRGPPGGHVALAQTRPWEPLLGAGDADPHRRPTAGARPGRLAEGLRPRRGRLPGRGSRA